MITSLLNRFKKREVTGMDLGSSGVKFVRIHRKPEEGAGQITQWLYPAPVQEEKEISAFRDFLRVNGLTGSMVACNIDEGNLSIRKLDLPKMPEADLREAVRWQIRDGLEGPVTDYSVRYTLLEEPSPEAKKVSLLAYAVKKSVVSRLMEFLKKLSLNPVLVEPTPVSLMAAFDAVHGWKAGETYGLIDFGESKTVFSAMGEGRLYFFRPLGGVSGRQLKEYLEKEPLESVLPGFHTRIAVETQKIVDAFSLAFRTEKIHRLFLCGGGAALPGLEEYLTKNVAIPTTLLDPSVQFEMAPGPSHLYDAALGLALYS